MGDLAFQQGDLVSIKDADGKTKLGTFVRRCMKAKKKTTATLESGVGATESEMVTEVEMVTGFSVYEDEYGDSSATTLVEAPWAIVKWNPCGGESPQYNHCSLYATMSTNDDIHSKVPLEGLTLLDRIFNPGERVSKFRKGRPPIQGHVVEVNVECDLRVLSPLTSGSSSVFLERVPYSELEPMGPFFNKNKIMSYVDKKNKNVYLGTIEKCKYDLEVEFPDGAIAVVPNTIPALLLDLHNMQFSCLKSHLNGSVLSGSLLHIGQQLLVSVANLNQVKEWVKSGTDFGTSGADCNGPSENCVDDKVVVTITRFVLTKFIPMWLYPTGHVCGKERLPYSFDGHGINQFEETDWTWNRNYNHARRTLSRSKHMYKLKEEDASTVNKHVSTSDSPHSTFCLNGNNNNNNKQGLIFNPCTCMSSLGLPPQSVSPTSFVPIIAKLKDSVNHKVGDSVPVEVTRTRTVATVLWQDGQVERDVPCCSLLPGKFGSMMKDFYPGNLVIEKIAGESAGPKQTVAGLLHEGGGLDDVFGVLGKYQDVQVPSSPPKKKTDLSSYGVILRADLKDRTALVKWIRVNKRPKGDPPTKKECTERDPEEMSIYDLAGHPSVLAKFAVGSIVTATSAKPSAKCKKLKKAFVTTDPMKSAPDVVKVQLRLSDVEEGEEATEVSLASAAASVAAAAPTALETSLSNAANIFAAFARRESQKEMDTDEDDDDEEKDKENVPADVQGAVGGVLADNSRNKFLGMVKRFDPTDGRFEVNWLDGSTSKELPHELASSMTRDCDPYYEEEDDYYESDAYLDDYYDPHMMYGAEASPGKLDWTEPNISTDASASTSKHSGLNVLQQPGVNSIEHVIATQFQSWNPLTTTSNQIKSNQTSSFPQDNETESPQAGQSRFLGTLVGSPGFTPPPLPPKLGQDDFSLAVAGIIKAKAPSLPPPQANDPCSIQHSPLSTPKPDPAALAFSPQAGLTAGLSNQVTQLSAVANGASHLVSAQAASFAAAEGGSNGVPINVAQVLSTVAKLRTAMELVVDVIGELETSIKTAANATQSVTNCANCASCSHCHPSASLTTAAAAAAAGAAAKAATGYAAAPPPSSVSGAASSGATTALISQNELLDYKNIMAAIKEETERKTPQLSNVTCLRGHPLVKSAYENRWVCDGRDEPGLNACRPSAARHVPKTYQPSTPRYRCVDCDYDLCEECHKLRENQLRKSFTLLIPKDPGQDLLCVEKFLMLDQIHDSHYYCRENRIAKHSASPPPPNAPSKASIAVQKELQKIKSSLPDGIYVRCFEDHLDMCSFAIEGPVGTPYEDGLFLFDVHFRDNYPKKPPLVHYISYCKGKLNPNLYEDGLVCLSLLGTWDGKKEETWNAKASTFLQVLVSIQALVLNADPYYNEPGFERERGSALGAEKCQQYNEVVLMKLLEHMTKILDRPVKLWDRLIVNHFRKHGWRLYHRVLNMMALSAKLTEERVTKDRATSDGVVAASASDASSSAGDASPSAGDASPSAGEGEPKPVVDEGSNLLVNFPLLPLTKGGCISLQRGLAAYKEALLGAGFREELSVFRSEDIALPGVDESRI